MRDGRGLTIIEVLVAITVLAIVGVAVVGSLSVAVRLNLESSGEVDYSRVVRTASEQARLSWSDAEIWSDDEDGGAEARFLDETVAGTGCAYSVRAPSDLLAEAADAVRVIAITCPPPAGTGNQLVFEVEIAQP